MNKKLSAAIAVSVAIPFACTDRVETIHQTPPEVQKIQEVPRSQSVDVREASERECVSGGIVYTIYFDNNSNAVLDSEDTILKKYSLCNGSRGADGSDGANGENGSDGRDGLNGQNGQDGKNGQDGQNGRDGNGVAFAVVDASSAVCSQGGSTILMATDIDNTGVYRIDAPNQHAMIICNGQNAQVPAYTPVDVIHACGDNVAYKEVLLRLSNGNVLGSFSNDSGGTMTRLAFLSDGTFMNTDGSGCTFTLSTSADGKTRSVSWAGRVQKTWVITP